MVSSVLSALLLGMVQVTPVGSLQPLPLRDLPIAPPGEELTLSERLSASGVLVVDAVTGQRLLALDAQLSRPMASITKLMTALIIVENHSLYDIVTIPETLPPGSFFVAGEHFFVGDLLSALLISSSNEAASILAQYHSGSQGSFVAAMNVRAKELGLTDTHYANAAGFDDPEQVSSPRDIAALASYVLGIPTLRTKMGTPAARIVSREGSGIPLAHTHALLGEKSIIAGKTGTTDGAGQCLMSLVDVSGREFIVVLLKSNRRYDDMRKVLRILQEQEAPLAAANVP